MRARLVVCRHIACLLIRNGPLSGSSPNMPFDDRSVYGRSVKRGKAVFPSAIARKYNRRQVQFPGRRIIITASSRKFPSSAAGCPPARAVPQSVPDVVRDAPGFRSTVCAPVASRRERTRSPNPCSHERLLPTSRFAKKRGEACSRNEVIGRP